MRPFNRPEVGLIALGGAIVLAVVGAFIFNACSQYEAALESARRSALSFASIVGEHTARSFEAADRTLREVETIRDNHRDGKYAASAALKQALQHLQRTSPVIVALGWTDAQGNMEAHSSNSGPPRPSIATMQHFLEHRDAEPGGLFVGAPFQSAANGHWISAISRRISDSDGRFAGVVSAALEPSYFSQIYKTLDIGPQGVTLLVHRPSQSVMVREPPLPESASRSYANRSTELDRQLAVSEAGVFPIVSQIDGRARIVAYKAVPGTPLAAVVAIANEDVLQPWLTQMMSNGAVVAALVLIVVLGTFVVLRQARKLSEQASLLSAALDNMDQGLITVSKDDRIVLHNRRAIELLDLPPELMARRPHADEVLAYQARAGEFESVTNEVRSRVKPQVENGVPAHYERVRPNGTALEIRTVPFADGGVVRTYTDVTARRAAEEALRRQKEHAETAARAKSDFLATMSHELRTPLTAIIGVSDLLMVGEVSAHDRRRYLEMQRDAGKGLLQVVDDVLDLAKIEAGELAVEATPFDLVRLTEGCVGLFRPPAEHKRLRLDLAIRPDVSRGVCGDPTRLRQVLMNLLSNALKFTERGFVSLAVEKCETDWIRFTVRDTGIGIDCERLPMLFDRFTQGDSSTARQYGGTGLGLAISKELVALMGGTLSAESQPGTGSSFSFSIPLPAALLGRDTPASSIATAAPAKILVVEDGATTRELIVAMLSHAGHDVRAASNGQQAAALAGGERFDVILMDIQMPGIDGYAAARLIARTPGPSRSAPVLALTANATSEEVQRALAAGMKAHVAKPIDWQELNAVIGSLVRDEGPARAGGVQAANLKLRELADRIGAKSTERLLQLFMEEARTFLAETEHGEMTRATLAEHAHTFSGSAGMLGFAELHDACRDLETTAREGQPMAGAVARCRAERDRALHVAARWLADASAGSGQLRA